MEDREVRILKLYNRVKDKNKLAFRDYFSFKKEIQRLFDNGSCPNRMIVSFESRKCASCDLAEKIYDKNFKDKSFSCTSVFNSHLCCLEGYLLRNDLLKIKENNLEVI